jgi:AcrR family transcriptional regulator
MSIGKLEEVSYTRHMSTNQPEKVDRRVARTRRDLRRAFMELVAEAGYERLGVNDITERAGIGRATFYLHYMDKEQLLLDCIDQAVTELKTQLEDVANLPIEQRVLAMTERVFDHMAQQAVFYRTLMSENGVASLSLLVRNLTAEAIKSDITTMFPQLVTARERADAIAQHTAGALLALAEWWLRNNCPGSAREMAMLHVQLAAPGIFAALSQADR